MALLWHYLLSKRLGKNPQKSINRLNLTERKPRKKLRKGGERS